MDKQQLLASLRKQGFSEIIVHAFERVARDDFIPHGKEFAYEDTALSIGYGQTISQPYTIAFMLSLLELKNNQKILEVGSGSGYVLALINEISNNSKIYGVERVSELVRASKEVLKNNKKIKIFSAGKELGLKKFAPYDRILVSAAAEKIPEKLVEQLKINGVMVIPIGNSIFQIRKTPRGLIKKEFYGFVFVPLVEEI